MNDRLADDTFRNSEALIDELLRPRREQIWVIGSGLTVPIFEDGTRELLARGVPGTAGMIAILRDKLREKGESFVRDFDDEIQKVKDKNEDIAPYQVAFRFARERVGLRTLNRIVRSAVLGAYTSTLDANQQERIEDGEYRDCNEIQRDLDKWSLRPGIRSIGQIVSHTDIKHTILTTNFDPLIEIAIRRASGSPVTMLMDQDDALSYTQADQPRIAHLHGYWFGSGLLHTQSQLLKERLRLKNSIAGMLKGQDVFVFGYGGWRDVMREALRDSLAGSPNTIVHWCFFEPREHAEGMYERILHTFRRYIEDDRFVLYTDVNADNILPMACDRLSNRQVNKFIALERQVENLKSDTRNLENAIREREQRLEIFLDLDARGAQLDKVLIDAGTVAESLRKLEAQMNDSLQQWSAAHESSVQRLGGIASDIERVFEEGPRRVNALVDRLRSVLQDSAMLEETKRDVDALRAELSSIKKQTQPWRVALSLFLLQGIIVLLIVAGWVMSR